MIGLSTPAAVSGDRAAPSSSTRPTMVQRAAIWTGMVALLGALLALRRPDMLMHPYVWAEDGTVNLRQFVDQGWFSLFLPVNNYLILVSKLICLISLKGSFLYYPEISAALAFAFDLATVIAVWRAPTVLPAKALCAIAVLLVPNGSECYNIPLNTIWFAGLLIALALLWISASISLAGMCWRIAFMILGGLSSPIIISFTPLFLLRALRSRTRKEATIAMLCVVLAATQTASLLFNPKALNLAVLLGWSAIGLLSLHRLGGHSNTAAKAGRRRGCPEGREGRSRQSTRPTR